MVHPYNFGDPLHHATIDVVRGLPNGPINDPNHLLRDVGTHFVCIHAPTDRRYTVLEQGFNRNAPFRKYAEEQWIVRLGNRVYDAATGTGSLNW
jgi:hypothetical protein